MDTENLINLETLNCSEFDRRLIKTLWENHLSVIFGHNNKDVESFIRDHGYLVPFDWLDTYFGFVQ